LARISLSIVSLWFGALKLLPDPSPLKALVGHAIQVLKSWLGAARAQHSPAGRVGMPHRFGVSHRLRPALDAAAFLLAASGDNAAAVFVPARDVYPLPLRPLFGGTVHHQKRGAGKRRISHVCDHARRTHRCGNPSSAQVKKPNLRRGQIHKPGCPHDEGGSLSRMFPHLIGAGRTLNAYQTLLTHAEQQVKNQLIQLFVGQRLCGQCLCVKRHGAQSVGVLRRIGGGQQRV